eukprot:19283-Karenia_brevis.AAC.1
MSVAARINYAQGYMFSKGLFNCATWPALSVSEHRTVHANVMRVYRKIYGSCDYELTDSKVLHELQAMSPLNLVRYFRLSFAIK